MKNILIRLLVVLFGYAFGLFQTGWFLGKLYNVNLKQLGSGNTGATNALRVIGIKGGLLVLLGDALKGFIPCMLIRLIFKNSSLDELSALIMYCALGCVLGNNHPFFLKFNGGKGIAVSLGWMLAWQPKAVLVCLAVFLILAFSTRYVSIASLACCVAVTALTHIYASQVFGPLQSLTPSAVEFVVLGFLIPLLVILRHHGNIERLIKGNENRFGKK